jgi:hypothetical protein
MLCHYEFGRWMRRGAWRTGIIRGGRSSIYCGAGRGEGGFEWAGSGRLRIRWQPAPTFIMVTTSMHHLARQGVIYNGCANLLTREVQEDSFRKDTRLGVVIREGKAVLVQLVISVG